MIAFLSLLSLSLKAQTTIIETMDAYRDDLLSNTSSSYRDFETLYYRSNDGHIVNYIGDLTLSWGIGVMKSALKFQMPQTTKTLASASLYIKVIDINDYSVAKISLTDDNNWAEASTNSTFPGEVNLISLISAQSITSSGWNQFSLPVSNIQAKISSSSSNTMSLIITGSGALESYFNFYADNDAISNSGSTDNNAYLKLVFKPQVQSVSVPANTTYKIGDELNFTVNYDEAVTVTGTPQLPITLNTGGTVNASYVSGSGTSALNFSYTVVSGNLDADGITVGSSLSLNNGTIKNGTTDAELTLYSVGITTGVKVDGERPTAAITLSDAALKSGETSTVTFTFNEVVTGFTTADLTASNGDISNLSTSDGGTTWTATFTPTASITAATNVIALDNSGVSDNAGNAGSGSANSPNYVIDTQNPSVTIASTAANPTNLTAIPVTVTFSEFGTSFVEGDVTITNGTIGSLTGNGVTYTFNVTPSAQGTVTVAIAANVAQDAAGNNNTAASSVTRVFDGIAPTISSSTPPTSSTYIVGQNLDYTVNFSEAVIVNTTGGTPYLTLTIGSSTVHASYLSGSGTMALVFRYTVTAGDIDADGVALTNNITSNGATLKDAADNNANLALTGGTTANVKVDGVVPTISTITPPNNGYYKTGNFLNFTITFSETVIVTGSPYLSLTIGGTTKQAAYQSGSGTSSLVFRYTAAGNDLGDNGITLTSLVANGATLTDQAGNSATITLSSTTYSNVKIDNIPPAVGGVSNGATYTTTVTPSFTEGTATISRNGATAVAYSSNTAISTTGNYTLVVTDAAGNSNTVTFSISIATATDEKSATAILLYPNPCAEGFHINIGEEAVKLTITDLAGRQILEQMVSGNDYVATSQLKTGIYIVKAGTFVTRLRVK